MFGFILGLAVGVGMPLQTSVNAELGEKVRSPYIATTVSFIGGVISCALIVLLMTGGIVIPFADIVAEPWWIWTGGVCGTILVVISIVSLPKLGSTETMIMLILGQIFIGLAVDSFGMFKSDVIPLTVLRFAGFMLVLAGSVAVSYANGNDSTDNGLSKGRKWFFRILAIIGGILAGTQVAVNGRLGVVVEQPFTATLISMAVGFIGAIILIAFLYFFRGGKTGVFDLSRPKGKVKWWMCTGGLFSAFIVGGNVILANLLGTGLSLILNITGQAFGGVIVDAVGFLGIEKKPVTFIKIAGIVVAIIGIVLVNMF